MYHSIPRLKGGDVGLGIKYYDTVQKRYDFMGANNFVIVEKMQ